MTKEYFKVWDKIAEKYGKDRITSNVDPEHKKIFKENLTKGNVLDVGCATGKHLLYLQKKGFITTGIDISDNMIKQARKLLHKNNIKTDLVIGSATNLPFADNSFDNVICMGNSIGSIPGSKNRINAIKEIIRVSRCNIIFELLKSDTTKEVKAKYWFSAEDERYITKRWSESEISKILLDIKKKVMIDFDFRIKKGRKSVLEKYLFYVIINKN